MRKLRKIRILLKRWFLNLKYSKLILDFTWTSIWFWLENKSNCSCRINNLRLIKLEKFENGWNLRNSRKYLDILEFFKLEKKSSRKFKA